MGPLRLLLADDDDELRQWLGLALRSLFRVVVEASDGAELQALLLGEERFDLVITDLCMPHRSGFDVAVRAREAGVMTPIIFLTGRGDEATTALVARMENTLLLRKPVDFCDLVARIRRLLSRAEKVSL